MPLPFSEVPAFRLHPLKRILDRAAGRGLGFVPLYLHPRPTSSEG